MCCLGPVETGQNVKRNPPVMEKRKEAGFNSDYNGKCWSGLDNCKVRRAFHPNSRERALLESAAAGAAVSWLHCYNLVFLYSDPPSVTVKGAAVSHGLD